MWKKLTIKSNACIVTIYIKCDAMVRLPNVTSFNFPSNVQVLYLLIIVFLFSKRIMRHQKGKATPHNAKVCEDLLVGRSVCPCALFVFTIL